MRMRRLELRVLLIFLPDESLNREIPGSGSWKAAVRSSSGPYNPLALDGIAVLTTKGMFSLENGLKEGRRGISLLESLEIDPQGNLIKKSSLIKALGIMPQY